jgi:hypothetical protein
MTNPVIIKKEGFVFRLAIFMAMCGRYPEDTDFEPELRTTSTSYSWSRCSNSARDAFMPF